MATRTGRLVVDPRTGKMVEEYKEDQMAVALFDPECAKPEYYKFRFVLRSDFTVYVPAPPAPNCVHDLTVVYACCYRRVDPRSTCSSTAMPHCSRIRSAVSLAAIDPLMPRTDRSIALETACM